MSKGVKNIENKEKRNTNNQLITNYITLYYINKHKT